MNRTTAKALAFTLIAGLTATTLAGTDIPFEQLPPPVQQTTKREVGNGAIDEIERDDDFGTVVYEIEFTRDGKRWEIEIARDGRLLERRED